MKNYIVNSISLIDNPNDIDLQRKGTRKMNQGDIDYEEEKRNAELCSKGLCNHNRTPQEGVPQPGQRIAKGTRSPIAGDLTRMHPGKAAQKSLGKALGYLGKAADKYPDDDDVQNGMAHVNRGLEHLGKVDWEGMSVSGNDIKPLSGDDATAPSKAAASRVQKASDEKVALARSMNWLRAELRKYTNPTPLQTAERLIENHRDNASRELGKAIEREAAKRSINPKSTMPTGTAQCNPAAMEAAVKMTAPGMRLEMNPAASSVPGIPGRAVSGAGDLGGDPNATQPRLRADASQTEIEYRSGYTRLAD